MDDSLIPASVLNELDLAFADGASQPTAKVAKVLAVSPKTLQRLADDRKIVCRRKGKSHRLFAREDVEAYLRGVYECRSTSRKEKTARQSRPTTISISNFGRPDPRFQGASTVRLAKKRKRQLEAWRQGSRNSQPSENSGT